MKRRTFGPHPITKNVRIAVFAAWNGKCAYCETAPAEDVDHIHPVAKGGADHVENYVASCERCNTAKRDLLLPEGFLAIITAKAKVKTPEILKNIQIMRKRRNKSPRLRSETFVAMTTPLSLIDDILDLDGAEVVLHPSGVCRIHDALRYDQSEYLEPVAGGVFLPHASINPVREGQAIEIGTDYFAALKICRALGATAFKYTAGPIPSVPHNCTPITHPGSELPIGMRQAQAAYPC